MLSGRCNKVRFVGKYRSSSFSCFLHLKHVIRFWHHNIATIFFKSPITGTYLKDKTNLKQICNQCGETIKICDGNICLCDCFSQWDFENFAWISSPHEIYDDDQLFFLNNAFLAFRTWLKTGLCKQSKYFAKEITSYMLFTPTCLPFYRSFWNYVETNIPYSKLQYSILLRWINLNLSMYNYFHPTLYGAWYYSSMLGLKLVYVGKRCPTAHWEVGEYAWCLA